MTANKTWGYTYDRRGNILSRKTYAYTTGTLGTVQDTDTYEYYDQSSSTMWGDALLRYDGTNFISYDAIGNPTGYYNSMSDIYTFSWQNGRQLASGTKGETTFAYTYNADGLRTKKVVDGVTTEYYWAGSQLAMMVVAPGTSSEKVLKFYYDAEGRPLSLDFNGTVYLYITNLQGDVVALADQYGEVIRYEYDAWGKPISTYYVASPYYDAMQYNPLRYRGYIYDNETGFYFLQSRYYDPVVGRFINADGQLNGGFLGNNLFAYCENNPVVRIDSGGQFWDYVLDICFIVWSVYDVINDPSNLKKWGALVVDFVFAVAPFVPSGVGQIIKTGNKFDNAADVASTINKIEDIQNAKKVTMIGRDMKRVTSTAKLIGKAENLYDVWKGYDKVSSISKPLANALSATHNGSWLFGKLRQGYTVIDIGLTTTHKGRGLWYGTERFVLCVWETRNIWKLPVNYYS